MNIVVVMKVDYGVVNFTEGVRRELISKFTSYLRENYSFLSWKPSTILPSVVVNVAELGTDDVNKLLIEFRSLEFVDTAEKV